ncbi:MAG: hypothetical protein KA144_13750 [Xanthomonadaceae bacterium]|nr:hypothetical protein [Xanthomonadaceae bacterium]
MHRFARVLAFVCLFAAHACSLAALPESADSSTDSSLNLPSPPLDIAATPVAAGNACIAALLRRIVEDDPAARGPQRLYVGLRTRENAADVVRVYWPQAHAILLIDPAMACGDDGALAPDLDLGWYRTKARIDLKTDVVATPEEIAGSTYLVDRAWVDAVIAESLRSEPLTIVPTESSP